ncbi:MAG: aminopeptidase P family N-terminal domain-containing protein, partial [Aestuariivirga sp.]
MPGYLDRHRAARLMQEQGLSALVLAQPESITYATGAFPGVASFWRRAGSAFVVVPADETAPLAAIVGDLQAQSFAAQSGIADVRSHRIWVETERYPIADAAKPVRSPRPAQYDFMSSLDLLRDVLAERSLLNERVGLELGFVPAADFPSFSRIPVEWTDCTRIVERLRAIKNRDEIGMLRSAAEYARSGITALTRAIHAGMDAAEMTEIWKSAAFAEAVLRTGWTGKARRHHQDRRGLRHQRLQFRRWAYRRAWKAFGGRAADFRCPAPRLRQGLRAIEARCTAEGCLPRDLYRHVGPGLPDLWPRTFRPWRRRFDLERGMALH